MITPRNACKKRINQAILKKADHTIKITFYSVQKKIEIDHTCICI